MPAIGLHVRVSLQGAELTRALAEGVSPQSTDELALRGVIAEAHRPAITRPHVIIVRRRAVFEAEDAINAMIERLRSPEPVQAEGMAGLNYMVGPAPRPLRRCRRRSSFASWPHSLIRHQRRLPRLVASRKNQPQ